MLSYYLGAGIEHYKIDVIKTNSSKVGSTFTTKHIKLKEYGYCKIWELHTLILNLPISKFR